MSEQNNAAVNRPDRDIVETMREYNQTTTMYYPWVEVAASEIELLRAKLADMTAIVELMWDKYEDGDPMYSSEDWEVEDALRTYIGQCVNFSEEEHQRILSSIPENRAVARAARSRAPATFTNGAQIPTQEMGVDLRTAVRNPAIRIIVRNK